MFSRTHSVPTSVPDSYTGIGRAYQRMQFFHVGKKNVPVHSHETLWSRNLQSLCLLIPSRGKLLKRFRLSRPVLTGN